MENIPQLFPNSSLLCCLTTTLFCFFPKLFSHFQEKTLRRHWILEILAYFFFPHPSYLKHLTLFVLSDKFLDKSADNGRQQWDDHQPCCPWKNSDWQKCCREQPVGQLRLWKPSLPQLCDYVLQPGTQWPHFGAHAEKWLRVSSPCSSCGHSKLPSQCSEQRTSERHGESSPGSALRGGRLALGSLGPEGWPASVSRWKQWHSSTYPGNQKINRSLCSNGSSLVFRWQ